MTTLANIAAKLYDVETRPELIAQGLARWTPAQRLLDEKALALIASMSTYAGLKENSTVLQEMAAPYIKKACDKEGRKELAEIASEKVIKPTKEFAAPYVAKLASKRAEIVASKRYEKAVSALHDLHEHPVETALELRSKAIDLLQYEKLATYREYIQSDEFQADTRRLVQVELPAIVSEAAARGLETVKQGASTLGTEIAATRGNVAAVFERGYEAVKKIELEALRTRAQALLVELQNEVADTAQHVRTEGFSMADAMMRIKRVASAIDSIVISPMVGSTLASPAEGFVPAPPAEGAPAQDAEVSAPEADMEIATEGSAEVAAVEVDDAAEVAAVEVDDAVGGEGSPTGTSIKTMDVLGPI
eukprot:CAMPEP_0119357480 /NCGR_PEP_ID=MMETSP1334-20130426/5853_1 /TAXON_ID=127549 /ORGANISM="Calcidiscus leptoporus, Strain RCC1130" /LENGTH=361 /DNA_ID=CAMNT_0007371731 /DNA_START=64 /DNA_END=1149 /DNA_ORIENTATION=-